MTRSGLSFTILPPGTGRTRVFGNCLRAVGEMDLRCSRDERGAGFMSVRGRVEEEDGADAAGVSAPPSGGARWWQEGAQTFISPRLQTMIAGWPRPRVKTAGHYL